MQAAQPDNSQQDWWMPFRSIITGGDRTGMASSAPTATKLGSSAEPALWLLASSSDNTAASMAPVRCSSIMILCFSPGAAICPCSATATSRHRAPLLGDTVAEAKSRRAFQVSKARSKASLSRLFSDQDQRELERPCIPCGKICSRIQVGIFSARNTSPQEPRPPAAPSSASCRWLSSALATGRSKVSPHSGSRCRTLTLLTCRRHSKPLGSAAQAVISHMGSEVVLNCILSCRGKCCARIRCTRQAPFSREGCGKGRQVME
mmetsp:Transcript_69792/g.110297  ORF Transcript_69792/g.110297 Transcript_69792/m.110297 type:complete len:262 (-) Transcript_69792:1808-2593(-)